MTTLETLAVTAVLGALAAGILIWFVSLIRREQPDPLDAPTELIELPPAATERRRLADDWREQIATDPADEPALVRPYVPQHDIDTIDLRLVGAGYWPVIGQARIQAALGDTGVMDLGEVTR